MSNTPITSDGRCINKLIESLKRKIGDKAAEQLKQTAVDLVQQCVDVYSKTFGDGDVGATGSGKVSQPYKGKKPIPDGTTGLIYGRVQSGKTNATIATVAIAQENKFRCFIVLTSDNTWLGRQTASRFNNQLKAGPKVYSWEDWHKDPQDFAGSKLIPYLQDTGVVLVSTKNVHHLDNLLKVLKLAKVKQVPTLIFDDEADNASLNTNEAKKAKEGKDLVSDSKIFEKIGKIRQEIANHIYIQITATPQSLLLQDLDHPCKPAFCAALPQPGDTYMGGDLFFTENSPYCYTVNADEIQEIKKQQGKINPGNTWNIPKGLRLALCCFFLGTVYKMRTSNDQEAKYSFLAHICYKRDNHKNLEKIISYFVIKLDKAIRGQFSKAEQEQALQWLKEAYNELNKTVNKLPDFQILLEDIKDELVNVNPEVINANNLNKEPQYNPGMNILIGGNRLGRGVTIEGLMITYYGRDAKQKMMDTVHQHARMYGYRQELKDVTRLFVPKNILEDFRSIYEADEEMRQAIGDDPKHIKIKPVWVGKKLKATRANVLNPTFIDAFPPGTRTFPHDPVWKASEVKHHTEKLNQLLANYTKNDDEPYEVAIDFLITLLDEMPSKPCPGYNWEDKRVKETLQAMKSKGIEKGILYVRRGKNKKEGLDLSNKSRPWQGSDFAQGKWISEPKQKYPDKPVLVVMYEKGEKNKGWDDQPLYLPTLIMPQSKFIFMFNYSEESEELEEQINWDLGEEFEQEWLSSAANNPAFDFLNDPEEDIYTLADGKPFHD